MSSLIFIKSCNNCEYFDGSRYCRLSDSLKNTNEYCEDYKLDTDVSVPNDALMVTLGELLMANSMIGEEL